VSLVRRALQKAFAEEHRSSGMTQTDIANAIGVHRSVINRELRGQKDITLSRVAELAWALRRKPRFELEESVANPHANADLKSCTNENESKGVIIGEEKKSVTSAARILEEAA
jgi:plasmid maintenance system antidote protein VapI